MQLRQNRLDDVCEPRRAQDTFDTQCQKCFCVTFGKSNKTPAIAGHQPKREGGCPA